MRNKKQIIEQEYLITRAKILEIAAFLDRLQAAGGELSGAQQHQLSLLQQGLQILTDQSPNKTERGQLAFSRKYDPQWRSTMGV